MATSIIWWERSYHEDLGTQDEQGFYDYAYQYFVYTFYAASGSRIVIRRYTDEPARGSIFLHEEAPETKAEDFLIREKQFVAAVVTFMQSKEGVEQFDYFSGAYHQLDLNWLRTEMSDFAFKHITDGN